MSSVELARGGKLQQFFKKKKVSCVFLPGEGEGVSFGGGFVKCDKKIIMVL